MGVIKMKHKKDKREALPSGRFLSSLKRVKPSIPQRIPTYQNEKELKRPTEREKDSSPPLSREKEQLPKKCSR